MSEPLTKDEIAFLYLTEEEQKMETHDALLQIVLGLQSCKTKEDVVKLLQDVRALQQRIEYAKVASAVRLLRERIISNCDKCRHTKPIPDLLCSECVIVMQLINEFLGGAGKR